MEAKRIVVVFIMMFVLSVGFSQESPKKAKREKNKIEKQHQIEALINSREFVFEASQAMPKSGTTVNLTGNTYTVTFHPEEIESYMPFFGRAYSADYGGSGGIKFKEKPDEFSVSSRKGGKGFEVNAAVSVRQDNYKLILSVSPGGSATLSINSNQLSSISYYGDIVKYEKSKEK